jgi:hypothetical protein
MLDPVLHSELLEFVAVTSQRHNLPLLCFFVEVVDLSTQLTGSSLSYPSCLWKLFSRLVVDGAGSGVGVLCVVHNLVASHVALSNHHRAGCQISLAAFPGSSRRFSKLTLKFSRKVLTT